MHGDISMPSRPPADDIGLSAVHGHRRQVLLAAEREAEDWIAVLPPGPLRDEQERAALKLRELREAEAA